MKMEQKIEIKRKNWQKTHCDHTLTQMFKCFFEVMFDTIVSFIVWTFLFARMDSVHWTHIHTLLCTAHVWHFSSSVLAVMRPRNSSHEKSIIFSIGQWTTHIFTFSWSRNVADDLMNNRQVYMTVEVIGGIGEGGAYSILPSPGTLISYPPWVINNYFTLCVYNRFLGAIENLEYPTRFPAKRSSIWWLLTWKTPLPPGHQKMYLPLVHITSRMVFTKNILFLKKSYVKFQTHSCQTPSFFRGPSIHIYRRIK